MLGEGPVWVPSSALLYWIDVRRPSLNWVDIESRAHGSRLLPKLVGAIVERKAGGLLMAFRSSLAFLDDPQGGEPKLITLGTELGDERFNDGKCDAAGRFWVGTLDRNLRSEAAALYKVDAALHCSRMDERFTIGNGIAWSPDSKAMYFTDTRSKTIFAYDFDLRDGAIENRRVFVRIGDDMQGRPDGCAMDVEGCLWSAMVGGGGVRRFDPDGRLMQEISLPVHNATSCCFGGPSLTTLFVTSARETAKPSEQPLPLEGGLFAIDADVAGMAVTPFSG
jgi:sugar lactone lactonase YvrE